MFVCTFSPGKHHRMTYKTALKVLLSAHTHSMAGGANLHRFQQKLHYSDVMMGAMASQINSLTIVYSTVYSGADQRKHRSSASLAFARGIHRWLVNFPDQWQKTRKMFPFDDVIMFVVRYTKRMDIGLTRHDCLLASIAGCSKYLRLMHWISLIDSLNPLWIYAIHSSMFWDFALMPLCPR